MYVEKAMATDEIVDFLKWARSFLSNINSTHFIDSKTFLEELNLSKVEQELLPAPESLTRLYEANVLLNLCKGHGFYNLIETSMELVLENVLMAAKEGYPSLINVKSHLSEVEHCVEVLQANEPFLQNRLIRIAARFVDSLFQIMDNNYSISLNNEKISVNMFIRSTICRFVKYSRMKELVIHRMAMMLPNFITQMAEYEKNPDRFYAVEQVMAYLLIWMATLTDNQKKNQLLEVDETVKQNLTELTKCSFKNISLLATSCLDRLQSYGESSSTVALF